MEELTCCFTGYRPQKLPFTVKSGDSGYIDFENTLVSEILSLVDEGCTTFISGMAMGFDIIAAECVLTVKEMIKDTSIRLVCAVPFAEQPNTYPPFWKEKYDNILKSGDESVIIADKYSPSCYMKRNIYMVDNADIVMTYFDGQKGGTKNTVDYAKKKKRRIINLCKNYI